MWWVFQVLIMTLIIGSSGAYNWAGEKRRLLPPLIIADGQDRSQALLLSGAGSLQFSS